MEIELIDYQFRPEEHPDEAAIEYSLRFVNNGSTTLEVQFSVESWTAYDNKGVPYGDYHAVSKRAYDRGTILIIGSIDWPQYLERKFTLQPGQDFVDQFWLNKESAGWQGKSRVDIDTDWVQLVMPEIRYRGTKFYTLRAVWRLIR